MTSAHLVGAGVALGGDRAVRGSRSRAVARSDEDAVTLAVQAAGRAMSPLLTGVRALVLATTTPPYTEGGSTQPIAEMLDLQGDLFTVELTATARDGLAAIRLGASLVASHHLVLVVAAHADDDGTSGSGAVALLLADPATPSPAPVLATLEPLASITTEIRDQWRLAGNGPRHRADPSFVDAIATTDLAGELDALVPGAARPTSVVGPHARAAAARERLVGGPGDDVAADVGTLGAAHPLLRLLHGLDAPSTVTALAAGMGEAVAVDPTPDGAALATALRSSVSPGRPTHGRPVGPPAGFAPYASIPRAWRERDVDFRLAGIVERAAGAPARSPACGTVITWTRDHVYPSSEPVEMVAVDLDRGGQFFGQVAVGESVAIGDRVELVPRRLHEGNGMIQYFWKVQSCR